jgi:hypothetical protein
MNQLTPRRGIPGILRFIPAALIRILQRAPHNVNNFKSTVQTESISAVSDTSLGSSFTAWDSPLIQIFSTTPHQRINVEYREAF